LGPIQWANLDHFRPPKKALGLSAIASNLKNQAPLAEGYYEWVSPITGNVVIRKHRVPVLSAEEVSSVKRLHDTVYSVPDRQMSVEAVTGTPSLVEDIKYGSAPSLDPGYVRPAPVVFISDAPAVDPVLEEVHEAVPASILVSDVKMPEPANKPDPSLVFSLAGCVGKCVCGKGAGECVVYVDSRPDRSHSNKGYRMVYGNPFHVCCSVDLDGKVVPLKAFITSVFAGGANLPPECLNYVREYLRASFYCDWYFDPQMDPPLVQTIVLEESDYFVPGSRKMAFFYARVKRVYEGMVKPFSEEDVWTAVFKDFSQMKFFYAEAVLGRSFWPAGSYCPCPDLPVTPLSIRTSCSAVINDAFRCSNLNGLFEVESLPLLGRVSAVLAHQGMWLTVVNPHASSVRHRYLGLGGLRQTESRSPEWGRGHLSLTLRDGPVTVDFVNLGHLTVCERDDLFLRPCPALVFRGGVPCEFVDAHPHAVLDVFRPQSRVKGWPDKPSHHYTLFDVPISPHDREVICLYVKMIYDLRPYLDVSHWVLILPWTTFGEIYLAAIRFLRGGFHGRISNYAIFCLENQWGWIALTKVVSGHIVGISPIDVSQGHSLLIETSAAMERCVPYAPTFYM